MPICCCASGLGQGILGHATKFACMQQQIAVGVAYFCNTQDARWSSNVASYTWTGYEASSNDDLLYLSAL